MWHCFGLPAYFQLASQPPRFTGPFTLSSILGRLDLRFASLAVWAMHRHMAIRLLAPVAATAVVPGGGLHFTTIGVVTWWSLGIPTDGWDSGIELCIHSFQSGCGDSALEHSDSLWVREVHLRNCSELHFFGLRKDGSHLFVSELHAPHG